VAAVAAGARTEPEVFAALDEHGLRDTTHNPSEVTGYAMGLPGDLTAAETRSLRRAASWHPS
jgi:hypothetical protein